MTVVRRRLVVVNGRVRAQPLKITVRMFASAFDEAAAHIALALD
jgi:hypothetical protein